MYKSKRIHQWIGKSINAITLSLGQMHNSSEWTELMPPSVQHSQLNRLSFSLFLVSLLHHPHTNHYEQSFLPWISAIQNFLFAPIFPADVDLQMLKRSINNFNIPSLGGLAKPWILYSLKQKSENNPHSLWQHITTCIFSNKPNNQ